MALLSQARGSKVRLETELQALRGLTNEVLAHISASEGPAALSPCSPHPRPRQCAASGSASPVFPSCSDSTSVASTWSCSSSDVNEAPGSWPPSTVAESRLSQRGGGPDGSGREAAEGVLQELHAVQTRCSRAAATTASLCTGLEDVLAARVQPRGGWASPRPPESRRGREADTTREAILCKQAQEYVEENKALCREAYALGARAARFTRLADPL